MRATSGTRALEDLGETASSLAWMVWQCRLELALLAVLAGLQQGVAHLIGTVAGFIAVALLIVGTVGWAESSLAGWCPALRHGPAGVVAGGDRRRCR